MDISDVEKTIDGHFRPRCPTRGNGHTIVVAATASESRPAE